MKPTRNDSRHNQIYEALKDAGYHVGLGFIGSQERGCLRVIVHRQPVTLTLSWERVENVPGLAAYLILTHSGTNHDGTPWLRSSQRPYSPKQLEARYRCVGDTPDWYKPEGGQRVA